MGTIQVAGCVLHPQNVRLVRGRENGCPVSQVRVPFLLGRAYVPQERDYPGMLRAVDTGPGEVVDFDTLRQDVGHDEGDSRHYVPGMAPVSVRSTSRVPCFGVQHVRKFDRLRFRQNVRSYEHWPVPGCRHVLSERPVGCHVTACEPPPLR